MASIFDLMEAPIASQIRESDRQILGSVQAARDAAQAQRDAAQAQLDAAAVQGDAVPTAGATERDIANLVFSSRVGGVPGSGSNLLRSREAASTANQIRAQNRAIAADRAAMAAQLREGAAGLYQGAAALQQGAATQMGEFAMRAAEESAYAESVLQEMRAAGEPGDRIMRVLNRLKATMTTDAGRAFVDNLILDESIEYRESQAKKGSTVYIPEADYAEVESATALGQAYGE
jgi:hypothetical protein